MHIERVNCSQLSANTMPDGSRIIRNSENSTVLALNAEALRRTLQQLEEDPTLNPGDPAFVNLKCAVLLRIAELEDMADMPTYIQAIDPPEPDPVEPVGIPGAKDASRMA
jgi:hypothetical protein